MKVNKRIYGKHIYCQSNAKICKLIKSPLPEQELLCMSARFINNLSMEKQKISVHKHIIIRKRAASKIYHRAPKKKLYRTALEHQISFYNQLPQHLTGLKSKTFATKLKKVEIEYKPED